MRSHQHHPHERANHTRATLCAAKRRKYVAVDNSKCLLHISQFLLSDDSLRLYTSGTFATLHVQVAKTRIDNLFDRLAKNQSISRVVLKHAVSLMVSRLGPRFSAASAWPVVSNRPNSSCPALHCQISSSDHCTELRTAGPDTVFALLQKMQETL
jgi:hypothetical protein